MQTPSTEAPFTTTLFMEVLRTGVGGLLITRFQITAFTGTPFMTVSFETGMETPTTATR